MLSCCSEISEQGGEAGEADATRDEDEGGNHIAGTGEQAGEPNGRGDSGGPKVDHGADEPAGRQSDREPLYVLHAETERQVGLTGLGDGPGVRAVFGAVGFSVHRLLGQPPAQVPHEAEHAGAGRAWRGEQDGDDRYQIALMLYEIAEEDVHKRIEQRLRRAARQLVRRHCTDIERIAAALMERCVLSGDEIDAMLSPGFMARPATWDADIPDIP